MKHMKTIIALAILLLASSAIQASTVTITPGDCIDGSGCWTWTWPDNNAALHADDVEGIVGETDDLVLFYKADQGDGEEGPFADSYDTVFENSPTDPEDALISYISGDVIDSCDSLSCYLVIKDGNQEPGNYIYDLSDLSYLGLIGEAWNGLASLDLNDFWVGKGAISNVAIYGVVPVPAAFWLFGTALVGFIGISRRRAV